MRNILPALPVVALFLCAKLCIASDSNPATGVELFPGLTSCKVETVSVNWFDGTATLRLQMNLRCDCDSVKIEGGPHFNALNIGDSIVTVQTAGMNLLDVTLRVSFALHDTSGYFGILRGFASSPDCGGDLISQFGMFFDTRVDPPVASTTPPWQLPANLGGPPPHQPRMMRLPEGEPLPAGAKILGPMKSNQTMAELRQMEQWALDPEFYMEIEIADGKLWKRYLKEYAFEEVPNSGDSALAYLKRFADELKEKNAARDALLDEQMAKKKQVKEWGISLDSMKVLEQWALTRSDYEMITVEGHTFGRDRDHKEFLQEILINDKPRNNQPYLLDLRDSEHFAIADSIVDSLHDTSMPEFYWTWLDPTKLERLRAAKIVFETYWGPRTSDHSKIGRR